VKCNPTMNQPSTTGGTRLVTLPLERQFSKKLNDRIGSAALDGVRQLSGCET